MNNKAFTLVELIIVVIIVGILAAFAVPAYRNVLGKHGTANILANDAKLIGAGLQRYLMESGGSLSCDEPSNTPGVVPGCNSILNLNINTDNPKLMYTIYQAGRPGNLNYFIIVQRIGDNCAVSLKLGDSEPYVGSDCN